jgi:hypothetical protein
MVRETSRFGRKWQSRSGRLRAREKGPRSGEHGRAICLGQLLGQRNERASILRARGFALTELGERQQFEPACALCSSLFRRTPDRCNGGIGLAACVRDRALDEQQLRKIDAFAVASTISSA